ncbi:MAG: glycosyltransferase family 2 protein [Thermoleophilaceae bacterium]
MDERLITSEAERDATSPGDTQTSQEQPLISVGVPTWERAHVLRRAIDSVLVQTYENFELVVCDNASQDSTEAICDEYRRLDPRVRYFRHATNIGLIENFNSILERARGDYLMFLADDDWIEDTYLQHCLDALRGHPDRVLARGKTRYFNADGLVWRPEPVNLIESSPSRRVRAYYANVEWNEEFYGLIRQDTWARVGPIPTRLGGDLLMVSRIAFLGKAVTLDTTELNRATGGISDNAAAIAQAYDISPRQTRIPFLSAAWFAVSDIAWRSSVYESLSPRQRLFLALSCVPSWLARMHRRRFRRVRNREMYQARKRARRWSRRADRGGRRRLKKIRKRARVARRHSVRLLRQRVGALLLRR